MDNRTFQDRRKKPTPILSRYTIYGRRCSFRRAEDQKRGGYVDRYGQRLFFYLLLIVGLNILDASLRSLFSTGVAWRSILSFDGLSILTGTMHGL